MKRIGTRTGEKRGGQTNNTHEDEEQALVVFDEGDVADGIAGCENSLIKKVISEKTIHKQPIQTAMANIWNNPNGFLGLKILETDCSNFILMMKR